MDVIFFIQHLQDSEDGQILHPFTLLGTASEQSTTTLLRFNRAMSQDSLPGSGTKHYCNKVTTDTREVSSQQYLHISRESKEPHLPSGYVKIAIENGPVEIVDLPVDSMMIFHSYVSHYQRVLMGTSEYCGVHFT
jgi:hypothetical protein